MNIALPPPPRSYSSIVEREQWLETLWLFVRPSISTAGDVNFEISSGATYHGITALSAPRTLTLPPSSESSDGIPIVIQDESGGAAAHTVTLAAAAGDTIRGLTTITTNYGRRTAVKRGKTWFVA